jgi:hypothetical protein
MSKKSIIKLMTSVVLVAALCMGTAVPAFAAYDDDAIQTDAAAITKKLQVPVGTLIPEGLKYEFIIKTVSEDGLEPTSAMPILGTQRDTTSGYVTIDFEAGQTPDGSSGDTSTFFRESVDLLAGVQWPHAGVYEYLIWETEDGYTPSAANPKEEMVNSQAKYTMYVYVKDIAGTLTVTHVGVLKIVDELGTVIPPANQVKVDPTPGGDPDVTGDYSEMAFVNSYVKTNGGTDPRDPSQRTLSISKAVTGTFADPSTYFAFSVKVTKPTLVAGTPTYKAYVINTASNTVVTSDANYSGTIDADGLITFTSGAPLTVNLKHGQALVFVDTHVGSSYTVTETGNPVYTASAQVTVAGVQIPVVSAAKGADLALPTVAQVTLYVGETAANGAAFTNNSGDINPTGISVDNMPYVVLIAFATVGLVGYVGLKSRKENGFEV